MLEDFEALEETAYRIRSAKNTRRLLEAVAQLEEGKGLEKEISDEHRLVYKFIKFSKMPSILPNCATTTD